MRRINATGVISFDNKPVRVHSRNHGDLRDTFLVAHGGVKADGGILLKTEVCWTVRGVDDDGNPISLGGFECIIAGSIREMAEAKQLFFIIDDNFSGYGNGLTISRFNSNETRHYWCILEEAV